MAIGEARSMLTDRLAAIEARIAAACRRASRSRDEVTIVAVTKTVGIEVASIVPELGVRDLGESRPQELWRKAEAIHDVRWHLVGHLQRNKAERTLPLTQLIHSVDSERLLQALQQEAVKQSRSVDVLLEVNTSREIAKHGFTVEELIKLAPRLAAFDRVRCQGLMTMAAFAKDPEQARPAFRELHRLGAELRGQLGGGHLSMGMTNDFEVAIEEGATLVRIGSALFEGLPA